MHWKLYWCIAFNILMLSLLLNIYQSLFYLVYAVFYSYLSKKLLNNSYTKLSSIKELLVNTSK